MRIKFDHVYQFRVDLKGVKPPIWRRILIPCNYSFWDLHVAIQDAMGWHDRHLHAFYAFAPTIRAELQIGIPPEDSTHAEDFVVPCWLIPIAEFFTLANRRINYEYDFGDGWEHEIRLETILPRDKKQKYPQCTGGRRACPPEDCGGPIGYEDLLATLSDTTNPDREAVLEVMGGYFDPNRFDPSEIRFDDPAERFEHALGPDPVRGRRAGAYQGLDDGVLRSSGEDDPAAHDPISSPAGTGTGQGWELTVKRLAPSVEKLRHRARQGFHGFPVATVVLYGPNDSLATKMAVGIIAWEGADADPLERWYATEGDIRESVAICQEILTFIQAHDPQTVVISDGIMGCPHEEGIDYPVGQVCPECPFWAYHDRRTGETIQ